MLHMRPRSVLAGLLIALAAVIGRLQAEAEAVPVTFSFTAESAIFDSATGNVQFRIVFNQPPDFFTVDSVGRQANSFSVLHSW